MDRVEPTMLYGLRDGSIDHDLGINGKRIVPLTLLPVAGQVLVT